MKNSFLRIIAIFFLAGTLPGTLRAQNNIGHALDRLITAAGVPGVQITYFKNGVSQVYCAGEKQYNSGDSITPNTVFQACSMSKSVFAYAALILYDRGVFSLDTPLVNYWVYPRLSEEPEGKKITARMVLNHTTGLPNWTKPGDSKLKVAFEPGTNYHYSGEGYYYLQQVLEHITGKSLEEIVKKEVFQPFGMTVSSYVYLDASEKNYAYGHEGLKAYKLRKFARANAAYTLVTTSADYTIFVQKALIRGERLKPETHKMMLMPSSQRKPHIKTGLGVMMQTNEKGKAIFHNGSNPGFRCFYFTYPATGESLVCFTNGSQGVKIKKAVAHMLLGDQTFWCF